MTKPNQKEVYAAALTKNGVPPQLAEKAAEILVADDPTKPNSGRSESDQKIMKQSLDYLKEQ